MMKKFQKKKYREKIKRKSKEKKISKEKMSLLMSPHCAKKENQETKESLAVLHYLLKFKARNSMFSFF